VQQQLAGVRVLAFVALEREVEGSQAREDAEKDDDEERRGDDERRRFAGCRGDAILRLARRCVSLPLRHGAQCSAYTSPAMHPEVAELQTKLKEILYDCAVEIRATKAALYLYDGADRFEMITEYGFRGTVRQFADRTDPVLDRCGRGRNAFFINGLTAEPRFSELLYESSTDRLLAAPVYVRGQLVGMIDMRDKAGKQPFENADVTKATKIADRIAELFANKNVFNLRYITLSEMNDAHGTVVPANVPIHSAPGNALGNPAPVNAPQVMPAAAPVAAPPPPAPAPAAAPKQQAKAFVPRLATMIIEARTAAERIVVPPPPVSIG